LNRFKVNKKRNVTAFTMVFFFWSFNADMTHFFLIQTVERNQVLISLFKKNRVSCLHKKNLKQTTIDVLAFLKKKEKKKKEKRKPIASKSMDRRRYIRLFSHGTVYNTCIVDCSRNSYYYILYFN
jgi:ABC-type bacteriocin/lantibiotic exporter with double-glycine peptidase domain